MLTKKFTGERVELRQMQNRPDIIMEHIARYNFALQFVANRNVLDAACGSGYGTVILSWMADSVLGVDIDQSTIDLAKANFGEEAFGVMDLRKPHDIDFKFDTVVSFETIEHLIDPMPFLKWVRSKNAQLIFSIPLNMPSEFHKVVYHFESDVEILMRAAGFRETMLFSQIGPNIYPMNSDAKYILGVAK